MIGQSVADARDAEADHRQRHGGLVSPLRGVRYRGERGEFDLLRFVESDTDVTVVAFVREFEGGSDADRGSCALR